MSEHPRYSIVAPIYNEEGNIQKLYDRVSQVMDSTGESWELVTVNDGSRDESFDLLEALSHKDSRIKIINFARNFGHQLAVTAGLHHTSGDAVVVIDADLQDPPERWKAGYHVVYAVRQERKGESWFKLLTAKLFYRLIYRITDVDIPLDTGDFRLMDRKVVDALNSMPEHNRFIRGLTSWIGFKQTGVTYIREAREWGDGCRHGFLLFSTTGHGLRGFHTWRAGCVFHPDNCYFTADIRFPVFGWSSHEHSLATAGGSIPIVLPIYSRTICCPYL
jgi:polyisoprenyl-phosphate glycosyltransferase